MSTPRNLSSKDVDTFIQQAVYAQEETRPEDLLKMGAELGLSDEAIIQGVFALAEKKERARSSRLYAGLAMLILVGLGSGYGLGMLRRPSAHVPGQKAKSEPKVEPKAKASQQTASAQVPNNSKAAPAHQKGMDECLTLSDDDKRKCLIKVALKNQDIRPCLKTTGPAFQGRVCVKAVMSRKLSKKQCDWLTAEPRLADQCFKTFGETNNDVSSCQSVHESSDRVPCLEKVAQATNDKAVCKLISPPSDRNCWNRFARKTTDAKECEDFPTGDRRAECLAEVARQPSAPLSVCTSITGRVGKTMCFGNLGANNTNLEVIKAACKNASIEEPCIRDAAERLRAPSLCQQLPRHVAGPCYSAVAHRLSEPSWCEKIVAQLEKDRCYKTMAQVVKNPGLCGKIRDKRERDQCRSWMKGVRY